MLICINKWFYVHIWGFLQKDYEIFKDNLHRYKRIKPRGGNNKEIHNVEEYNTMCNYYILQQPLHI